MLQGAGGLQAQSVHHITEIVCRARKGDSVHIPDITVLLNDQKQLLVIAPISVASCLVEWVLSWGMSRMASQ